MEKQPYYIQIENREMYVEPDGSYWNFRVFANERERNVLSKLFTEPNLNFSEKENRLSEDHTLDPVKEYCDSSMVSIYETIYEFGDDEARSHIKKIRNNV